MKTRANKAVAKVAFGALALNAAFPALAFAAEAEQEGGISAILPDMAEFIPMLIAFIILWIILAKFGWPMFAGMLEKRENTIREALKKSEEAQIESERVLAEYNKQLADAKAQSAQIIADARSVGEAVKADITAQAQTEAADMIAKAKAAIEVHEMFRSAAILQGADLANAFMAQNGGILVNTLKGIVDDLHISAVTDSTGNGFDYSGVIRAFWLIHFYNGKISVNVSD